MWLNLLPPFGCNPGHCLARRTLIARWPWKPIRRHFLHHLPLAIMKIAIFIAPKWRAGNSIPLAIPTDAKPMPPPSLIESLIITLIGSQVPGNPALTFGVTIRNEFRMPLHVPHLLMVMPARSVIHFDLLPGLIRHAPCRSSCSKST